MGLIKRVKSLICREEPPKCEFVVGRGSSERPIFIGKWSEGSGTYKGVHIALNIPNEIDDMLHENVIESKISK